MGEHTLFRRLRQLRATVKAARAEVETLRDSMNRKSKADPVTGWEPAEDLHIQLGNALNDLDSAADYMAPTRFHKDQPDDLTEDLLRAWAVLSRDSRARVLDMLIGPMLPR